LGTIESVYLLKYKKTNTNSNHVKCL